MGRHWGVTDHHEVVAWPASRDGEGAGLAEGPAHGGPHGGAEEEGGDLGRHGERLVARGGERRLQRVVEGGRGLREVVELVFKLSSTSLPAILELLAKCAALIGFAG